MKNTKNEPSLTDSLDGKYLWYCPEINKIILATYPGIYLIVPVLDSWGNYKRKDLIYHFIGEL